MLDVVAIGDICVDLLTPPLRDFSLGDRQLWVSEMPMLPGGNAANFALGCAALGPRTGLAACLGGDPISWFLAAELRRANVRSFVTVRKGLEAGRTMAVTHADGTRQLITYNGSNLAFSPRDVPAEALEARHVHRSGYWWTPKLRGRPTRDLLQKARDWGAETSLDIATDPEGWTEERRASVLAVLPQVAIFFANEAELTGVFGTATIGAAVKEAQRLGVDILAVHRGDKGCAVAEGRSIVYIPGFPTTPRNPTGSGDLFNAGFVYGRLHEWSLERCARFANAVAALHLQGPVAYPTASAVRRFLRVAR